MHGSMTTKAKRRRKTVGGAVRELYGRGPEGCRLSFSFNGLTGLFGVGRAGVGGLHTLTAEEMRDIVGAYRRWKAGDWRGAK
jgi:hypothetical protein